MSEIFRTILIETRNVCTRSCWFCKFGQERKDGPARTMDWPLIEKIVANLKDLRFAGRVSWFWINEPLLDSRMPEILSLTRRHCPDAFLSLITNGDLLTGDVYARLRENGLDALGVSIYDDETLARVEPIRDRRLVTLDMRRPSAGVLENRAGSIRDAPERFEPLTRRVSDSSCGRPFTQMVVDPSGKVALCCSDMYGDVIAGDANSQRLEEVWDGEVLQRYRAALKERGRKGLRLCEGCSYNGADPPLLYPLSESPSPRRLAAAPDFLQRFVGRFRGPA